MAAALPAVELFSTSILSNHAVRKRHDRYTSVLTIKKIPYVYHDMASDEDAKKRWRSKARDPTIPGLLVHNEWRGTFAEFEEAVEYEELDVFLAIDHERLKREQALLAGSSGVTDTPANGHADGAAAAEAQAGTSTEANGNADASKPASAKYYGEAPPPFAPEGSGKRRSLTADDFLKALGIDENSLNIDDAELTELLSDSSLRKANQATAEQLGAAESLSSNGVKSNAAYGIGASAALRNAERKAERAVVNEDKLKAEGLGPLAEGAPVELFTTSLLANAGVRQRHERYMEVLSSNQIHFRRYDLVADEEAKKHWRAKTRDPQLPGLLVHGEWRGSFSEFDAAARQGADALAKWLNIDARLANASVKAAAAQALRAEPPPTDPEDNASGPPSRSNRFSLGIDEFLSSLGVADLKLDDFDVDELLNGVGVPDVPGGSDAPIPALNIPSSRGSTQKEDVEQQQPTDAEDTKADAAVPEGVAEPKEEEISATVEEAEERETTAPVIDDEDTKTPKAAIINLPVADAEPANSVESETQQLSAPIEGDTVETAAEAESSSNKDVEQSAVSSESVSVTDADESLAREEAIPEETKTAEELPPLVIPAVVTPDPEPAPATPTSKTTASEAAYATAEVPTVESPETAPAVVSADAETPDTIASSLGALVDTATDATPAPPAPPKSPPPPEPAAGVESPAEKDASVPKPDDAPSDEPVSTPVSSAAASPATTMRKARKSKTHTSAAAALSPSPADDILPGRRGMDYQRPAAYALPPSASMPVGSSSAGGMPLSPDLMSRSASSTSLSVRGESSSSSSLPSASASASGRKRSGSGSAKRGLGSRLSSMKFGKDRSTSSSSIGVGDDSGEGGSGAGDSSMRSRPSREGLFRSRSPGGVGNKLKSNKNRDQPPVPAVPRVISPGSGLSMRAERTLSQILRDADEAMRSAEAQMADDLDEDADGGGGADAVDDDEEEDGLDEVDAAADPFGEAQTNVGMPKGALRT